MEMYEVKAVMDYEYYAYKDSWELARLISYMIAQTNSSKRLKIEDILSFHWDEKKEVLTISNEDVRRLLEKAQQYENILNSK